MFFNGFTDRKVKGSFVSIYTREVLKVTNWWYGQPDNWEGMDDCIAVGGGKLYDIPCSVKACSLVHLKQPPKLQLRGVCDNTDVDQFYTMLLYNETVFRNELLGIKQT